jgi:hypothetical protein
MNVLAHARGFRNQFMHFKPIIYFDNAPDEHIVKRLKSIRLPIATAYRDQMIQFPYSFMSMVALNGR